MEAKGWQWDGLEHSCFCGGNDFQNKSILTQNNHSIIIVVYRSGSLAHNAWPLYRCERTRDREERSRLLSIGYSGLLCEGTFLIFLRGQSDGDSTVWHKNLPMNRNFQGTPTCPPPMPESIANLKFIPVSYSFANSVTYR